MISMIILVWRSGSTADLGDSATLNPIHALGPRIALTSVFLLGMTYLALILITLRTYSRRIPMEVDC